MVQELYNEGKQLLGSLTKKSRPFLGRQGEGGGRERERTTWFTTKNCFPTCSFCSTTSSLNELCQAISSSPGSQNILRNYIYVASNIFDFQNAIIHGLIKNNINNTSMYIWCITTIYLFLPTSAILG